MNLSTRIFSRTGVTSVLLAFSLFAVTAGAEAPDGYYDAVDDRSPGTLRTSLHQIIDDHLRFPYTASETDTWDVLELADEDLDDPGSIVSLYLNRPYAKQGGGNDFYNREHVWPRSYGFPDNGPELNYPFTDMHHLFLADTDYNFYRSNKPYEDCDGACAEWMTEFNDGRGGQGLGFPGDSNWTDGEYTEGRWQAWSGRKGDIARALFYMDLRYEGGSHGVTGAAEPNLVLTDDRGLIESARTNRNEAVAYMGMLSTLLRWNREDPVDEAERRHHETVAAYQGNRNPFVDRPEWADCLFLDICGVVINPGMNDAWFNPEMSGQGALITVLPTWGQVFLAMFTFDLERPLEGTPVLLGAPGQRWLTALGPYQGAGANLSVEVTRGGVFGPEGPVVEQVSGGTFLLEFRDCMHATLRYEFPALEVGGEIPLVRAASDNAGLCDRLNRELQAR